MAARSSGIFPREGFNLDEAGKITATATGTDAPFTLTAAKTIRIVVVGAGGIDDAGTNKITVTLGGQATDFNLADLDGKVDLDDLEKVGDAIASAAAVADEVPEKEKGSGGSSLAGPASEKRATFGESPSMKEDLIRSLASPAKATTGEREPMEKRRKVAAGTSFAPLVRIGVPAHLDQHIL